MGGTPKIPKPQPPPPPPAIPETGPEVEEFEIKKARQKRGWEKTIITGALIPKQKGLSTIIG